MRKRVRWVQKWNRTKREYEDKEEVPKLTPVEEDIYTFSWLNCPQPTIKRIAIPDEKEVSLYLPHQWRPEIPIPGGLKIGLVTHTPIFKRVRVAMKRIDLIVPRAPDELESYNPLESEPELLFKFARINIEKEEEILSFVSSYGLLGAFSSRYCSAEGGRNMLERNRRRMIDFMWALGAGRGTPRLVDFYLEPMWDTLFFSSLFFFKNEVKRVKRLLSIYEAIQDKDKKALEQLIPEGEDFTHFFFNTEKRSLKDAYRYLSSCLAPYLETSSPVLEPEPPSQPEEFRSTFICPSLITAIYLQFYLLITEGKRIRRCRGCDMIFPPDRSNQYYHDVPCKNRINQRKYYETQIKGKKSRAKGAKEDR